MKPGPDLSAGLLPVHDGLGERMRQVICGLLPSTTVGTVVGATTFRVVMLVVGEKDF